MRSRLSQNSGGAADGAASGFQGNLPAAFRQQQEYYAGCVPRMVETGASDETYIEILSGLSEGEQVVLPPLATGGSQGQTNRGGNNAAPFGGMGGGIGNFGGGGMRR